TLSAILQPSPRLEAPAPAAPIVGVSFGGSAFTAVPASKAIMLISPYGESQPARGAHHDAVRPNTFLHFNALSHVPHKLPEQRPDTNLDAVGPPSSPSADFRRGAEGLLSEAYVRRLESQAGEEQAPGVLSPSGKGDEVLTAVPSESGTASADDRAVSN